MNVYVYLFTDMCIYIHIYIYMCVYIYIYIYVHIYIFVCIYISCICIYICICICIYIYIYLYIHIFLLIFPWYRSLPGITDIQTHNDMHIHAYTGGMVVGKMLFLGVKTSFLGVGVEWARSWWRRCERMCCVDVRSLGALGMTTKSRHTRVWITSRIAKVRSLGALGMIAICIKSRHTCEWVVLRAVKGEV